MGCKSRNVQLFILLYTTSVQLFFLIKTHQQQFTASKKRLLRPEKNGKV